MADTSHNLVLKKHSLWTAHIITLSALWIRIHNSYKNQSIPDYEAAAENASFAILRCPLKAASGISVSEFEKRSASALYPCTSRAQVSGSKKCGRFMRSFSCSSASHCKRLVRHGTQSDHVCDMCDTALSASLALARYGISRISIVLHPDTVNSAGEVCKSLSMVRCLLQVIMCIQTSLPKLNQKIGSCLVPCYPFKGDFEEFFINKGERSSLK